tara:strand:+ start:179 stop:412 length:234 start_codon:yes stop_codon:yes gene_type:complete
MSHLLNNVNGFFLIKYIMKKLDKYKQNLTIQGNDVWSYSTIVAKIDGNDLKQLGWWSVTTQKHINYVAKELNLELIK